MEASVGANWAASHTYAARGLLRPGSVDELKQLVQRGERLRGLGSRHSFNDLADTTGDLVSLERFEPELVIDASSGTATVSAGQRYGDIAAKLHGAGWAVHNLASLPHISVAGAIATGTHGSGDRNGTLSSAVAAIELVDGRGVEVKLVRGDADFDGAVVSLGAIGVVTRVTLDIQPTFDVRQSVYENLPWSDATGNFDEVVSSAYSVSLVTNWLGESIDSVWLKSRADAAAPPSRLLGATPAAANRHIIASMPAENMTEQMGVAGPWSERLAHFRLGFTPSSGEELQSEYLVPRSSAIEAIEAVREIGSSIAPLLYISEIRTMAADTLWLSGAFETPAVGIHFTWKKLPEAVGGILPAIEDRLLPLGARPHWGKVFAANLDKIAPLYRRLDDFRALAGRYDPAGLFRNAYLERTIGL